MANFTDILESANELSLEEQLDIANILYKRVIEYRRDELMKDVDSSISVTYTLPENSTWKDAYDLIIKAYDKGVKSIAAFPDRKMYGIISYIPFKDLAVKLYNKGYSYREIAKQVGLNRSSLESWLCRNNYLRKRQQFPE